MSKQTFMTISLPGVTSVGFTGDPAITAVLTPAGDGVIIYVDGTMTETATVNIFENDTQIGSVQVPNLTTLMTMI